MRVENRTYSRAGNDVLDVQPPVGEIWNIDELQIDLSNDATVANRIVTVYLCSKDATAGWYRTMLTATANQTAQFVASTVRTTSFTNGGSHDFPMHLPICLDDLTKLRIIVTDGVAGDTFLTRLWYRSYVPRRGGYR